MELTRKDLYNKSLKHSKNVLADILAKHVVNLDFLKTNGEIRHMECTLKSDYLPTPVDKDKNVAVSEPKNYSEEILRVFSIQDHAWRSFRIENFISLTY